MSNPTFINIANDDVIWFHTAADEAEVKRAVNDTATWFGQTIKAANSKCSLGTNPIAVSRVNLPADKRFQIVGVCGTGIVLANGTTFRLNSFDAGTAIVLAAATDPDLTKELDEIKVQEGKYLENFDKKIKEKSGVTSKIEVFVHTDLKVGAIHLDLGYYKPFRHIVPFLISAYTKEFSNWITNPVFGSLERKVTFLDDGVDKKTMDLNVLSSIDASTATVVSDPPAGVTCTLPCEPSSCNIDIGDVTGFNVNNGTVAMNLEAIVIKNYCRNPEDEDSICP